MHATVVRRVCARAGISRRLLRLGAYRRLRGGGSGSRHIGRNGSCRSALRQRRRSRHVAGRVVGKRGWQRLDLARQARKVDFEDALAPHLHIIGVSRFLRGLIIPQPPACQPHIGKGAEGRRPHPLHPAIQRRRRRRPLLLLQLTLHLLRVAPASQRHALVLAGDRLDVAWIQHRVHHLAALAAHHGVIGIGGAPRGGLARKLPLNAVNSRHVRPAVWRELHHPLVDARGGRCGHQRGECVKGGKRRACCDAHRLRLQRLQRRPSPPAPRRPQVLLLRVQRGDVGSAAPNATSATAGRENAALPAQHRAADARRCRNHAPRWIARGFAHSLGAAAGR